MSKAERDYSVKAVSKRELNVQNLSAGIVSALLAFTGPPVIILEAAAKGNFTNDQTIFWMFSVYFFGGLFSVILPLILKTPIVGAHSITGVAFLTTVTAQVSYNELIGSYIFSSFIILLIGVLGFFSKLMTYVPKEIIAAMMAGIIIKYVEGLIVSIPELPLVGGIALLVFLIFTRFNLRIPPVIAAIFIGLIVLFISYDFHWTGGGMSFVVPQFQVPSFDLINIVTISIPLALMILSNDIAPGIGALKQNDFQPRTNKILALSGVFSFIANLFGGQSANLAGMMSAICSGEEAGPKQKRYIAAIISGILIMIFGLFAWGVVPFIQSLPRAFVSMLAGFALIGVLGNSLKISFSQPKMLLSTSLTFVIAMSPVQFFYISAPVWALVAGTIIANIFEKNNRGMEDESSRNGISSES